MCIITIITFDCGHRLLGSVPSNRLCEATPCVAPPILRARYLICKSCEELNEIFRLPTDPDEISDYQSGYNLCGDSMDFESDSRLKLSVNLNTNNSSRLEDVAMSSELVNHFISCPANPEKVRVVECASPSTDHSMDIDELSDEAYVDRLLQHFESEISGVTNILQ